MKIKKIKTLLAGTALMLMCFSSISNASNYIDSPYHFDFSGNRVVTNFRPKQDSSSVYMVCEKSAYSYTAHVISRSTQTAKEVDCSNGRAYLFNQGTTCFMENYVYEWGYGEAAIRASKNYNYNYFATGKWSPDSI